MVLLPESCKNILKIFWVQLPCLEKILIDLLICLPLLCLTSVYYKETDSLAYVKCGSVHPSLCKNAISHISRSDALKQKEPTKEIK